MTARRALAASVVAGCVASAVQAGLRRTAAAKHFERTNHRGGTVTMLEGPAYAAGALTAVAIGAAGRARRAALIAGAGAAAFGLIDDLVETPSAPGNEPGNDATADDPTADGDATASGESGARPISKGLTGHLGALRRGRITTGSTKILGITASGIAAAALALPQTVDNPAADDRVAVNRAAAGRALRVVDVVLAGGVIAGSANLVNLFDLRPGRALKVTVLAAAGQAVLARTRSQPGPPVLPAAASGAAAAMLPGDLGERSMLGDAGANTAGALLGVQCITGMSRAARLAALATIAAATIASEKVSFTAVIESTPGLRELDRFGRPVPGRVAE